MSAPITSCTPTLANVDCNQCRPASSGSSVVPKDLASLDDLISGYHRFRKSGWMGHRERWSKLAEGQAPKVMIIACSDSRVDPSQIFDTAPGEMFVVRNVANLVPPFDPNADATGVHGVSAALEFAVTQLEVEEIVVMGHGFCGGCAAALTGKFKQTRLGEGGFIARWIELLDSARDKVVGEHKHNSEGEYERAAFKAMELEAVRVSLANLRSFPCIRSREKAGKLALHGAFFAVSDGQLSVLDEKAERWDVVPSLSGQVVPSSPQAGTMPTTSP